MPLVGHWVGSGLQTTDCCIFWLNTHISHFWWETIIHGLLIILIKPMRNNAIKESIITQIATNNKLSGVRSIINRVMTWHSKSNHNSINNSIKFISHWSSEVVKWSNPLHFLAACVYLSRGLLEFYHILCDDYPNHCNTCCCLRSE